jgi:hypothetical protein
MVIKFLMFFSPVIFLVASDSVEVENNNKFNAVALDSPALRVPRCCSSSSSSSESSESGSSSSQEKGWRVVFNDPRSKSRCGSKHCTCGAAGSPYYCAFVAAPPKRRIPQDFSSSSSSESVPSPCSWSSFSKSTDSHSEDSSCSSSSSSSSSS